MKRYMGDIGLSQLKVDCIIGCNAHEREKVQEILLDLSLTLAFPHTDTLSTTVNYDTVANLVREEVQKSQFYLIERLAVYVAELLLNHFSQVEQVCVTVTKPHAVLFADSATCKLKLSRQEEIL